MNTENQQIADQELRVQIAKLCGYKVVRFKNERAAWFELLSPKNSTSGVEWASEAAAWSHNLPDYLCDLNAMHEAEAVFHSRNELAKTYYRLLEATVYSTKHSGTGIEFQLLNVTARQRARAFLNTFNYHEDSK